LLPYTPLIKQAMCMAEAAHRGQYDKGGYPYILHPLTVAHTCNHLGYTSDKQREDTIIVALLHDVFEDNPPCALKDLTLQGFSHEVIVALKLLTHKRHIPYMDYISAIAESNSLEAKLVKYADLAHNLDTSRLSRELTTKDFNRMEKYIRAKNLLASNIEKDEKRMTT